jgi:hypothetical protein
MPITKIWENALPASFEVDGFDPVIFPVWQNLEGTEGLRAVKREVPWVDGVQIDETGLTGGAWSVIAPFANAFQNEDGMGEEPALYPTRLEMLLVLFRTKKTGTLHLPWQRNIRCKATSWRRGASSDMLDGEVLNVAFDTDNENKLDQAKAQGLAASSARQLVIQAQFDAERNGAWNGSWEELTRFTSQLEALMNAPSEYRQDVAQRAGRVADCCDRLLSTFSSSDPGRDAFLKPAAAPAVRALVALREVAEGAEAEARQGRPQIVTRTVQRATTIWEFAIAAGTDPYELLQLNPQIMDPNNIPPGTQIKTERA